LWVANEEAATRVIKRKISSAFWFIRELLPYGEDCIIISPDSVRSLFIDELQKALDNYAERLR